MPLSANKGKLMAQLTFQTSNSPADKVYSAVSDMPSPVSRPPQTCIFLDPTRMPREIRDMIYEEVIEQEYFRGRDWNCPGWRHWRGEIRTLHGGYVRYREHRDCLPAVAAVCKQIQEEFIERLYRKAKFYLTISMDYYHTNVSSHPSR